MLKKMKNRLKDQRGLTLIELLAVIVILGIIAAIAIPSISSLIQKSREDAVTSEAVQVLNAAKLYATSNNITADETLTNGGALDAYLDNTETYTITIDVTGTEIEYKTISVTKGTITKAYATETALITAAN